MVVRSSVRRRAARCTGILAMILTPTAVNRPAVQQAVLLSRIAPRRAIVKAVALKLAAPSLAALSLGALNLGAP